MLFFSTSFNLIIPELNQYISNLGGAELKGLVIGLFTLSAGISRPFSGKLADIIGRKKVMLVGVAVCLITSLLYPLFVSVWLFLVLRFVHGFSTGFFPTGATALVTDELPEHVRGSGMGIWGTFISLGIGVGQGLGSTFTQLFTINGLFIASACFAAISYILMLKIEETLPNPQPFRMKFLLVKKDEIIERSVIPVAVVMFLSASCSGVIFVLVPDIAAFLKLENKGWFFLFYVISTIAARLFTGRLSDRIGRRQTLLIGMALLSVSMVIIGYSTSVLWFTLSSVLFGIATGTASPTIFAWTADLSPDHRRGIGAGTMFIALEFGILFGSLVTGAIYKNTAESVVNVFIFGGSMAALCVGYLIWHLATRESRT